MSHPHPETGEHVGLPDPEHELPAADEERTLEQLTAEVMPAARVEELTQATTEFLHEQNILSLNADAVTDLQNFEATGTLDPAGAQAPAVDPKKPPPERTLARRAAFLRTSATVWPTKPVLDPAAATAAAGHDLVGYYESRSANHPSDRDGIEQETASFGTSLDEYVKSRMPVDATDPACTDEIVAALRKNGASPDSLLAAVDRFGKALSDTGMDVAAATAAGQELLTLLGNLETGLEASGRPITETARYVEMSFGLSLYVGHALQHIAEGQPVTPRSDTARGHDLSIRLRTVEATSNKTGTQQLAAARTYAAQTQDLITKTTAGIPETKKALAALEDDQWTEQAKLDQKDLTENQKKQIQGDLATNAAAQRNLKNRIASDQSQIAEWQRTLTQQKAQADGLVKALQSDAAACGQLKATIASPGKGKKFTMWRDSVDQAVKGLGKLGLAADYLAEVKEILGGVRDGVDEAFAGQMKSLADLTSSATTATVLETGWAFARRLSDVQEALQQVLNRPRAKADDVKAALRQLQLVVAALAGSLSERVATRIGVGAGSKT